MTRQQQRIGEAFRSRSYYGMNGMGANPTGQETQQGAASTVGSSLLSTVGLATAVGGPIAGGIVAAAGAIANIVSLFGPNPNNTYTTEIVNQVEADVMKPNLAAWQALPASEKTAANQAAAEAVFNQGWNYVVTACTNPSLGSAGINCIADRQRGGKYDWFAYYYTPIATDPAVAANEALGASTMDPNGITCLTSSLVNGYCPAVSASTSTGASTIGATISTALGGISPLMIGAALIAFGLLAVSE